MALDHERKPNSDGLTFLPLRSTANPLPNAGDDDILADVDEPPDHRLRRRESPTDFHRSAILPQKDRKQSLLTQALQTGPPTQSNEHDIYGATDMARRRSTMSNTSAASTADLTSDESITSPTRANTPSPPIPKSSFLSFAPFLLDRKPAELATPPMIQQDPKESVISQLPTTIPVSKPDPAVEALVKKRRITFACGGQKPPGTSPAAPRTSPTTSAATETKAARVVPKQCTIKFACAGPRREVNAQPIKPEPTWHSNPPPKDPLRHQKSPSTITEYLKGTPPRAIKVPRDLTSTVRQASHGRSELQSMSPPHAISGTEDLQFSELTRFHEFASDVHLEDDWITKDTCTSRERLTISDTLKKENAIRQLGKEVEEDEGDDNDDDDDDEEETVDNDGRDDETIDGSDIDGSDGNETDNEEGFAESDDESDAIGDYDFWTPGRPIHGVGPNDVNAFRSGTHIAASESSIDSLKPGCPISQAASRLADIVPTKPKRLRCSRRIKIRPGTPDLPDSTDFVCGTLDEDRPLEDAYLSCIKARSRGKDHLIPQDIDPSFPTSDPENEVDDAANDGSDSEEHVWLHGKFEDSDDEPARRHKHSTRKSPAPSPKRLHSPPPPKHRHRSPPPRRLFGGYTPRRLPSPPAHDIRSPAASPSSNATRTPIGFAALGHRPGLTHTKSLPRTPNVFDMQYRTARLAVANEIDDTDDTAGGHTRGAIDIVKGLEHKRQRRKEKLYQKLCNRARKGQPHKKPQPGKGAERMRDLGLQLAGKIEERHGEAEYIISL